MGTSIAIEMQNEIEAIKKDIAEFDAMYPRSLFRNHFDEEKLREAMKVHEPFDRFEMIAASCDMLDKIIASRHGMSIGTCFYKEDEELMLECEDEIESLFANAALEVESIFSKTLHDVLAIRYKQRELTSVSYELADRRTQMDDRLNNAIERCHGAYMSMLVKQIGNILDGLDVEVEMAGVDRDRLPRDFPGIYFLLNRDSGEIEYIGRSKRVKNRLGNNHHRYNKDIHVICIVRIDDFESMKRTEALLIQKLSPPLNTAGVNIRSNDRIGWTIRQLDAMQHA